MTKTDVHRLHRHMRRMYSPVDGFEKAREDDALVLFVFRGVVISARVDSMWAATRDRHLSQRFTHNVANSKAYEKKYVSVAMACAIIKVANDCQSGSRHSGGREDAGGGGAEGDGVVS